MTIHSVQPTGDRPTRPLVPARSRQRVLAERAGTALTLGAVLLGGARLIDLVLRPADPVRHVQLHLADPAGTAAVGPSSGPAAQKPVAQLGPMFEPVPPLVRTGVGAARQQLRAHGFRIGSLIQQDSATVPRGAVIGTAPGSGTALARGSLVNLLVSTGRVRVPDLTGRQLAVALRVLRGQLQLTVTVLQEADLQPRGTVLAQSARDAELPQGGRITLTVSAGAPSLPMPMPTVLSPVPVPDPTATPTPTGSSTATPTATPTDSPTGSPTATADPRP